MDKDIEILQDWIARDREMRNNSTQSDYDKFCEEKCEAIEHIICENAQYSEHNRKLEQALIDTDRTAKEYKKAYEILRHDVCMGRECVVCPYDEFCESWAGLEEDYFLKRAKEELNNGERKEK